MRKRRVTDQEITSAIWDLTENNVISHSSNGADSNKQWFKYPLVGGPATDKSVYSCPNIIRIRAGDRAGLAASASRIELLTHA